MDDDDEIRASSSPPNGRITVTVASASTPPPPPPPPPSNTLTLALPIQHHHHHKPPSSSSTASAAASSGREDCWSESATAVLIEAWGERYLDLSRGNLKQKHWKEVADVVAARDDYSKTPKTDIQCKNRIDTVKKKYKVEKAKIAAGGPPSTWRFYHKLDELIGPSSSSGNPNPNPKHNSNSNFNYNSNSVTINTNNPDSYPNHNPRPLPMAIPIGIRSSAAAPLLERFNPSRKRPVMDSDGDSSPENSADSSDGLPPENYKRPMMEMPNSSVPASRLGLLKRKNNGGGGGGGIGLGRGVGGGAVSTVAGGISKDTGSSWRNSMRELTRAMLKFGEVYEQAETDKLQQMVEIEKQRMKFAKDMELQRMQWFMKTQVELSQIKNHRNGGNNNNNNNNNNHHHHHHNDHDDATMNNNNDDDMNNMNNDNNNNSDSSN